MKRTEQEGREMKVCAEFSDSLLSVFPDCPYIHSYWAQSSLEGKMVGTTAAKLCIQVDQIHILFNGRSPHYYSITRLAWTLEATSVQQNHHHKGSTNCGNLIVQKKRICTKELFQATQLRVNNGIRESGTFSITSLHVFVMPKELGLGMVR